MKFIHETDVAEQALPGRFLRWIADGKSLQPRYLSSCVIRVLPNETVQPAHSHPNGEELIYVLSGKGEAWVDGSICSMKSGSAVLFGEGEVHMIRNVGNEEMKVVCFFSPPAGLENYKHHEGVEFKQTGGSKR